jgi:tRNA dimethylallyltransferase
MPHPLIIICGPTATGKSDLAVELAVEIGGEVINADSMQLYRGMDIGTAKLNETDRREIPHHLLDILDVRDAASVADYQIKARTVIEEIQSRNHVPILVGGTGLYIKSVIDEMDFPETDGVLRATLEDEAQTLGTAELYSRLRVLDPEAADAIEPANTRRIIRALEVIQVTGKPYSANLPSDVSVRFPNALHIGLRVDRPILADRISARVAKMWRSGFIEEVRNLESLGLRDGVTASRAIGYAQILDYFEGALSEDEAKEQTIIATRQYVRRQETWFKRDSRIQWLDTADLTVKFAMQQILERLNS